MRNPKPTAMQLRFLDWEFGLFFHFGIRTFFDDRTDWDGKPMDAAAFDPRALDCRQWVNTAQAAGARYCVLTAKHHDGFALWQSKYTNYGVASSPWKDGKGDVVEEFTAACRAAGLGVGLYYSPAQFGSAKKAPRDYDDYFIGQITELLTGYGKIDYLWFDGCGCEGHRFDRARIVKTIRSLQPDILLFNLWDPDTRWVGNEEGVAPFDLPCTVTLPASEVCTGAQRRFLPFECDCKLRPDRWFWSAKDADSVRPVENLMGLYELSVGRGGNLLLNVGPDDRGRIPDRDAAVLASFGARLKKDFETSLPVTVRRKRGALVASSKTPLYVDTVELREDLSGGERVTSFSVEYCDGGRTPATLIAGRTVGHRRILRIPTVLLEGPRTLRISFDFTGAKTPDVALRLFQRTAL